MNRRRGLAALAAIALASPTQARLPAARFGTVLQVGSGRRFARIGDALRAAQPGDVVEVDPGDYAGEALIIDKDLLTLRGAGLERPRLIAAGASAEGKGTVLVRALGVVVENLELSGARAPDLYGCGIRLERGSLRVDRCRFVDNELAIMTANDPSIVLQVAGCEFSGLLDASQRGRALAHTIYVGVADSFLLEDSYLHAGSVGHLVKSRARTSVLRYNRVTDEDGISSYEVEFPDGGEVVVVGNLIQQGRRSQNPNIVAYGAESLRWTNNRIDVLFNTVVNQRDGGGTFLMVAREAVAVRMRYNLLVGTGGLRVPDGSDIADNPRAALQDFADAERFDLRPRAGARWIGAASGADHALGALAPQREYVHPAKSRPLPPRTPLSVLTPGAFQSVAG